MSRNTSDHMQKMLRAAGGPFPSDPETNVGALTMRYRAANGWEAWDAWVAQVRAASFFVGNEQDNYADALHAWMQVAAGD